MHLQEHIEKRHDQHFKSALVDCLGKIVSAYVTKQDVTMDELPGIVQHVHGLLVQTFGKGFLPISPILKPAVPIEESVMDDWIICLEDGKHLKMLKRHLRTLYNLTPEEYRVKWGLADDYPMVAPNYAKKRSNLAKINGLGQTHPLMAAS